MNQPDLSLVPIEDLVAEIDRRTDHYVLAFCRFEAGNRPIITHFCSHKVWMYEVGLATSLLNTITEHYNGRESRYE